MPKKVIIFRHGETDYNKQGVLQGWSDTKLNKKGIKQAEKLANRLKDLVVDAFYTSDLKRAKNTAKKVSKKINTKPKETKKIRERYFGIFEGLSWEEATKKHENLIKDLEDKKSNWKGHGGESTNDVSKRVKNFVNYLKSSYKDKIVLLSTHGGTKRALLDAFGVKDNQDLYKLENTSVSIIEKKNNAYKLTVFNDISHLE